MLESIGLRRPKNATITIPTITLDTLVRRIGGSVDLVQMDVQGLEVEVLKGATESMRTGAIRTFLIGTHGRMVGLTLHQECRDLLQAHGYTIEVDRNDTKEQPDGILVATVVDASHLRSAERALSLQDTRTPASSQRETSTEDAPPIDRVLYFPVSCPVTRPSIKSQTLDEIGSIPEGRKARPLIARNR